MKPVPVPVPASAPRRRRQGGVATLEFALSLVIFVVALFGVIEFGRFMMAWNTAAEATQLASRLAAVCDNSEAQRSKIREKVRRYVEASGQVSVAGRSDWLTFTYLQAASCASNCEILMVETRLNNVRAELMIPALPLTIPLPTYPVRQMREAMGNVIGSDINAACD